MVGEEKHSGKVSKEFLLRFQAGVGVASVIRELEVWRSFSHNDDPIVLQATGSPDYERTRICFTAYLIYVLLL